MGPVSWGAIVLSKFLAEAAVMVLVVALYLAYLVAAAPLGARRRPRPARP